MSLSMLLIYGPILLLTPLFTDTSLSDSFGIFTELNVTDYLILLAIGLSSTYMNICRTRASQYEEPAKLAVVNYS